MPENKKIRFFFQFRDCVKLSAEYEIEELENPISVPDYDEKSENSEKMNKKEKKIISMLNFITIKNGVLTCKPRKKFEPYTESSESSLIESE